MDEAGIYEDMAVSYGQIGGVPEALPAIRLDLEQLKKLAKAASTPALDLAGGALIP